jgi:hypothetical protein
MVIKVACDFISDTITSSTWLHPSHSLLHAISDGNKGASSVSDVEHYVIIRKSLDSIQCTSSIHMPVRNSNILTYDFPTTRLSTQGTMYPGS